jgi:hypothetical protein
MHLLEPKPNFWKKQAFVQIGAVFLCLTLSGCQTYYQKHYKFNTAFEAGKIEEAESILLSSKPRKRAKDKLIYYANLGTVQSISGKYEESNKALEKGYQFSENKLVDLSGEALALLTNPNRTWYKGEKHEMLYLNYYKLLNCLKLGDLECAQIEARRLYFRGLMVETQSRGDDSFKQDAWLNYAAGLAFESAGDWNNAHVFYKRAVQAYEDYQKFFQSSAIPTSLQQAIVRSAWENGFDTDYNFFSKKFNSTYKPDPKKNATLLLLWHNGLSPVKTENRINLYLQKGGVSGFQFVNNDLGFSFPFFIDNPSNYNPRHFDNLKVISVALPTYTDRPLNYQRATVKLNGQTIGYDKVEDIGDVARKCLKDRILVEYAKAVSRIATKEAIRIAAREATRAAVANSGNEKDRQNRKETADVAASLTSFIVNIANVATEKADTRGWQTLPREIYMTKIDIPSGTHTLSFSAHNKHTGQQIERSITVEAKPGETVVRNMTTF